MKILILLIVLVSLADAWDNSDFEIYDLFEEVNGTFYELLNITQDATTSEIRRAYRRRSKELHPDRNKAENAELMFRQLASVYEILKDKEKREKYELVLRDGLPDWRQPMYYYRKYRKMGTLEISILVSIIATIGHYLTWWVAYLEKQFIMEEKLAPENKKRQKRRAKGEKIEDLNIEEFLEKELGYKKPGRWDFLPFVLVRVTKRFVTSIPEFFRDLRDRRNEEIERKKQEDAEAKEAAERAAQPKPKKVKTPKVIRDASEFESEEGWIIPGMPHDEDQTKDKSKELIKKSEWTEEDFSALAKAMAKFPGGTPGRWQRIAHELGRSPSDITKKVKEMKENLTAHLPSQQPGDEGKTETVITRKLDINLSDTIITKAIGNELDKTNIITDSSYQSQYDIPDDYDQGFGGEEEPEEDYTRSRKKKKVKTRPLEETKTNEDNKETNNKPNADDEQRPQQNESESKKPVEEEQLQGELRTTVSNNTTTVEEQDFWTQIQQKCLEQAIQQFPKSTSERWTCIARAVPGKTKEQCIGRYKLIAEQILKRKSKQSKGS